MNTPSPLNVATLFSLMLTLTVAWPAPQTGAVQPTPQLAQAKNEQAKKEQAKKPKKSKKSKNFDERILKTLDSQYKRTHQELLRRVLKGQTEEVEKAVEAILIKRPDDGETYYIRAMLHSQKKDRVAAERAMQQAIENGVPFGRFAAGPRELFTTLYQGKLYKDLAEANPIVHGPMLGYLTGSTVAVWCRTAGERTIKLTLEASGASGAPAVNKTMTSKASNDHVLAFQGTGLKPKTRYTGKLVDDKTGVTKSFSFTTAPATGKPGKWSFAFGGGAGFVPHREIMWNTVAAKNPDALMLLGDNTYSDDPESPAMQKYCYYRRQSRPEFRGLVAKTPVYAIWDDHDFGVNDCSGGPEIDSPAWKRPVWEVFKQNWANPAYGGGKKQPGCWFTFSRGDVDFFMLDGRYYRTRPRSTPEKERTMLGPVQKRWLLKQLSQSKATFKVIASPVPMAKGTKAGSLDTWDGFKVERAEIYKHIADNKIGGVFIISADRHRSDAYKNENPGSYPLYEFNSSKLTNQHTHGTMKHAIFSYNGNSFGLVHVDTTAKDPTLRYDVVNMKGETVHTLTVKRSDLGDR